MNKSVQEIYGNQIRTRICGLALQDDSILLVNHGTLYGHDFWAPPGGGAEFGQTIETNLKREFLEETGLDIIVGQFSCICEFILPPLHAMELFFHVSVKGGKLRTGSDPETGKTQIITNVRYIDFSELNKMPENHKHGLFKQIKSIEMIRGLSGHVRI